MLKFITERFEFLNNFFSSPKGRTSPNEKIYLTLLVLVLFRFANHIPLAGIDQDALKKAFSQFDTRNSLMQVINMYSGGGGATLLSAFSLGIIPFINSGGIHFWDSCNVSFSIFMIVVEKHFEVPTFDY